MVCDGEVVGELVVGGGTVLGASLDLRVGDSLGSQKACIILLQMARLWESW